MRLLPDLRISIIIYNTQHIKVTHLLPGCLWLVSYQFTTLELGPLSLPNSQAVPALQELQSPWECTSIHPHQENLKWRSQGSRLGGHRRFPGGWGPAESWDVAGEGGGAPGKQRCTGKGRGSTVGGSCLELALSPESPGHAQGQVCPGLFVGPVSQMRKQSLGLA